MYAHSYTHVYNILKYVLHYIREILKMRDLLRLLLFCLLSEDTNRKIVRFSIAKGRRRQYVIITYVEIDL